MAGKKKTCLTCNEKKAARQRQIQRRSGITVKETKGGKQVRTKKIGGTTYVF